MNILTYSYIAVLFLSICAKIFANFCILYFICSIFTPSKIGIVFGTMFQLFESGPSLCVETEFEEFLDKFEFVDYFKKI
ncbi:hypothetical protein HZS_6277 [Henneguya salminicola]|nr:hypothetical protein HZS_6277 [Henneguya salminicola]